MGEVVKKLRMLSYIRRGRNLEGATSRKQTALLAIDRQKLRELFNTLPPTNATKKSIHNCAKNTLHLKEKRLRRTLQVLLHSTHHNQWNTRQLHYTVTIKSKTWEFNKINDDEAIKLVITLHTHSEKLQWTIIQKDMYLNKVISTANSQGLVQWEGWFLKNMYYIQKAWHRSTHQRKRISTMADNIPVIIFLQNHVATAPIKYVDIVKRNHTMSADAKLAIRQPIMPQTRSLQTSARIEIKERLQSHQ